MSRRLNVLSTDYFPAYVVWEITLRCDLACTHCGSRAGPKRPDELTTAEALEVVKQLAAMRVREVVLIGGEAYLHDGFLEITRALKAAGVRPTITTGGRGVTRELARAMAEAGIDRVSVSIDGMAARHDRMRALKGSFAAAINALDYCHDAGITVAANTNLNRSNREDLEALYEELVTHHIVAWQIQITTPLGRAADRTHMIFQPWDLLDLMPRIAAITERGHDDGILVMPGNNLGYFGPEEALLRSPHKGQREHWMGCQAGKFVMGIESDGAVKGCPSLQTKHYVGGHLRERSLDDIWNHTDELQFARKRGVDDLWGYCRSCSFAEPCLGGCSFTAHALFGRPGNNPLCHYRAQQFAKEGKRERLVPARAAEGEPFDNGLYEIVVEELDAPELIIEESQLVQISRPPQR
jgi:radical SAM protein with 4Fe4S-binding SPASM domain